MAAKSSRGRRMWARRGLTREPTLDSTTHAMLLRQLYLAHFSDGDFAEAYVAAESAIELAVLPDVLHQDAARAQHAMGEMEEAIGHLRLAVRLGPASRRAFHWWTMGSLLYVAERYDDASAALRKAVRWGTTEKPLYNAHLALVRHAAGEEIRGVPKRIRELEECPAGRGYGRFVLGQLCFIGGRRADARRYLEAFVSRTRAGRRAMQTALAGELALADATLAQLSD